MNVLQWALFCEASSSCQWPWLPTNIFQSCRLEHRNNTNTCTKTRRAAWARDQPSVAGRYRFTVAVAAFNTVDHEMLSDRLENQFGVSGLDLIWLKSYLSVSYITCSYRITLYNNVLYHILLCGVVLLDVFFCIILHHIVWYCIISYHFVSYPDISYRIVTNYIAICNVLYVTSTDPICQKIVLCTDKKSDRTTRRISWQGAC